MSIQLVPVTITGSPFQLDNKNIPMERVGWIEFLNESLYTLQLQMGSVNINIPAWYDYPIQIQKVVQGIWQNTTGASLPINISPMLLPASSTAQSSTLLTTIYSIGETPAITTPQPLVRQAFIPNTVNSNAVSNTLTNESSPPTPVLIIDIGNTTVQQLIKIFNDGTFIWQVLVSGISHTLMQGKTTPNFLTLGQVGDVVQIIDQFRVSGSAVFAGNIDVTPGNNVILANGKFIQWKDTGGTIRNAIELDGSNNLGLFAASSSVLGRIYFGDKNGNPIAHMDSSGITIEEGAYSFLTGSISRVSIFTGVGTGTYNHGLGATPDFVIPVCTAVGSQTMGYDSVTSTQVHITCGSGLSFAAFAIKG